MAGETPLLRTALTDDGRLVRSLAVYGLILLVVLDRGFLPPAIRLLLLLPALMLGLAWLLGRGRLQDLELSELSPMLGFSGDRLPISLTVSNRGGRPLRDLSLRHGGHGGRSTVFALVPLLPGRNQIQVDGLAILPGRGRYHQHQVRAISRFPWGLWEWTATTTLPAEIVSWPRLGQIRALDLLLPRLQVEQGHQRRPSLMGQEFHGLEEWRPGRSLRQVHWRSSAHRNQLMIRINEGERQGLILITVRPPDEHLAPAMRKGAFERSLSLAASLCEALTRRRRAALLRVEGVDGVFQERLEGGQSSFFRILHRLTEVQLRDTKTPPPLPLPALPRGGFQLRVQGGVGTSWAPFLAILDPLDPSTRRWFREERSHALRWQATPSHQRSTIVRQRAAQAGAWTEQDPEEGVPA